MEFIDNKMRRYTTFSKRKTGIMKKAYELSTLTGTYFTQDFRHVSFVAYLWKSLKWGKSKACSKAWLPVDTYSGNHTIGFILSNARHLGFISEDHKRVGTFLR